MKGINYGAAFPCANHSLVTPTGARYLEILVVIHHW